MHLILFFAFTLTLLLAACAVLFLRLASRVNRQQVSAAWLENFSLEAYAPMNRLLDKRDVQFLASQKGYAPEIAKRLMAERRKVFAGYLTNLVHDFNQLMQIGKLMVVFSQQDREQFARQLFGQQVRFYALICKLRLELALSAFGWATVDARRVVDTLAAMRDQVQGLASPRMAYFEIA